MDVRCRICDVITNNLDICDKCFDEAPSEEELEWEEDDIEEEGDDLDER
jgi:hypothetical protein